MEIDILTYRDRVLPDADRGEERQSAHRLQGLRASGQPDLPHGKGHDFRSIGIALCRGGNYAHTN